MTAESCPYCGGLLIHDYDRGEVVCSSCGTVVDVIYECAPPHHPELTQPHRSRSSSPRLLGLREIRQLEEVVRAGEKKRLSEALVSRLPPEVKRVVEEGIKIAHDLSPTLTDGKTLRAKYAVGYITYSLLSSAEVDAEFVRKTFRLSRSSVKRLVSSVKSRIARANYVK